MNRSLKIFLTLIVAVLASTSSTHAQFVVNASASGRLVTEPSGARDDNNGGGDPYALVGLNTSLVENFAFYQMDLSALAGTQTSGATISIGVVGFFSNANHGQPTDLIQLNYLPDSNSGFDPGVSMITGNDTPADDGSISFLNRVQFSGSGTSEPWLDGAGNPVANLAEAIVPIATVDGWFQGDAPPTVEFVLDGPTAQGFIDDGIAAFIMSAIDDGDNRSRFRLGNGKFADALSITFETGDGGGGGSAPPAIFTVFRGVSLSGTITDFENSDDARALYNPGFTINSTEAPVWLIFDAIAPTANEFFVESQAGTLGLTYTVEAFDFTTQSFTVIGTQPEVFNSDQVVAFPVSAEHIDTGGEVQTRVGWRQTGFTLNFPWEVRVDQVGWNLF